MIPNDSLTQASVFNPVPRAGGWPAAPEGLLRDLSRKSPSAQSWLNEVLGPPTGLLMSREAGSSHARATLVEEINDGRTDPVDDCRHNSRGEGQKEECFCAGKSIELSLGIYLLDLRTDEILKRYEYPGKYLLARQQELEPALGWYLSKRNVCLMDDVLEAPGFLPRTAFDCAVRIVAEQK